MCFLNICIGLNLTAIYEENSEHKATSQPRIYKSVNSYIRDNDLAIHSGLKLCGQH